MDYFPPPWALSQEELPKSNKIDVDTILLPGIHCRLPQMPVQSLLRSQICTRKNMYLKNLASSKA